MPEPSVAAQSPLPIDLPFIVAQSPLPTDLPSATITAEPSVTAHARAAPLSSLLICSIDLPSIAFVVLPFAWCHPLVALLVMLSSSS